MVCDKKSNTHPMPLNTEYCTPDVTPLAWLAAYIPQLCYDRTNQPVDRPSGATFSSSPFNSHRWRSSPAPARLCAITVGRDTHGHGHPDNQHHNTACGIPYRDPPPDGDLSEAETTPERRYGLTDGGSESTVTPEGATSPASESETAIEMGLDKGMGPIPTEVADEEMLRWGRSAKAASRFDPIVVDAATETIVTRINGAPNNRLPENQTVEVGIAASSETQTGDYGRDTEMEEGESGGGEVSMSTASRVSGTEVGEGRRGVGEVSMSTASRVSLGRRWKKRVTFVVRTAQIWAFLLHVLLKLLRQKLVQKDEVRMSARRRKLGKYLCRAFLKLGPTFIKIGQVR